MFFVLNEHAGNGRSARVFDQVRHLLHDGDEVGVTQCAGDGRRLAEEAARAGHDVVVAVGGDGTINETVNGLAERGFGAALGILPFGGANDFAFTLGLPREPAQAMQLLRRGSMRPIDVAHVTFHSPDEPPRYYVNILGMGLSGAIAASAESEKRLGGAFTYLALLLLRMFRAGPTRFEVAAGGEVLARRALAAHVANGRREGRMFRVAPDAQIDDALLDVVAVEDIPRAARAAFILQVLRGRLLEMKRVVHRQTETATIRAVDPLTCHMDGEPFVMAPGQEARVEVRPGALRVVAP